MDLIRIGEAMLESAGAGIYALDLNGRCTFINKAALNLLGYSREECLGADIHALIHYKREDGTAYPVEECPIARTASIGAGTYIDDEIVWRKDGTCVAVEYFAEPIIVDGAVTGTIVTVNDISGRKRSSEALRRSEERFRSLVEATAATVWSTTVPGELQPPQVKWSAFTGQTPEELRGIGWLDAIHPDDRKKTIQAWSDALAGRSLYEVEHRLRGSDGVYRYMQARAVPILESNGQVREWVGLHVDITEHRQAQFDLEQAKAAAEDANRAKSQFLASMSHELRTPLNAIIGYSEMLEEEAEELGIAALNADLRKINSAGKHLLELINDVLDLSKIEAGKMDVFVETFEVPKMVEEVIATIEPLVKRNGNELAVRLDPDLGSLRSDLTKVRQTLFNLLSNAAKFTSNGKIALNVRRQSDDVVAITVQDSGIGMTSEQVNRLFEPFLQADRSTSRKYGGTGLGLAISKRFVEMLGGSIEVESEFGKGSAFTVRLPRLAPQARAGKSGPSTTDSRSAGEKGPRRRALIIDDDATARDLMRRHLAKAGFDPVLAGNGEEGLRLAREVLPAVITLDVMMSGLDGWAVLQELKADPDLREIPVIMATIVEDKNLGYVLGAADYLVKPIDRDELSRTLRRLDCKPPSTVLLVEDDVDTRHLLRSLLEREGWTVLEASDGISGLQRVEETTPQLILLDLLMPRMNGFAFALEVRKRPECAVVPIIVLTAKDITAEDRAKLNGSVEHILSKSTGTQEHFLQEIRRLARTAS